ncbi:hypothetical protein F5Y17DRAFT_190387 [Xylariaceae sp. FL0594]|nr:hypothetical protein F5Y17DRAFT_190387 [Xylariaceae sp. FL0594]
MPPVRGVASLAASEGQRYSVPLSTLWDGTNHSVVVEPLAPQTFSRRDTFGAADKTEAGVQGVVLAISIITALGFLFAMGRMFGPALTYLERGRRGEQRPRDRLEARLQAAIALQVQQPVTAEDQHPTTSETDGSVAGGNPQPQSLRGEDERPTTPQGGNSVVGESPQPQPQPIREEDERPTMPEGDNRVVSESPHHGVENGNSAVERPDPAMACLSRQSRLSAFERWQRLARSRREMLANIPTPDPQERVHVRLPSPVQIQDLERQREKTSDGIEYAYFPNSSRIGCEDRLPNGGRRRHTPLACISEDPSYGDDPPPTNCGTISGTVNGNSNGKSDGNDNGNDNGNTNVNGDGIGSETSTSPESSGFPQLTSMEQFMDDTQPETEPAESVPEPSGQVPERPANNNENNDNSHVEDHHTRNDSYVAAVSPGPAPRPDSIERPDLNSNRRWEFFRKHRPEARRRGSSRISKAPFKKRRRDAGDGKAVDYTYYEYFPSDLFQTCPGGQDVRGVEMNGNTSGQPIKSSGNHRAHDQDQRGNPKGHRMERSTRSKMQRYRSLSDYLSSSPRRRGLFSHDHGRRDGAILGGHSNNNFYNLENYNNFKKDTEERSITNLSIARCHNPNLGPGPSTEPDRSTELPSGHGSEADSNSARKAESGKDEDGSRHGSLTLDDLPCPGLMIWNISTASGRNSGGTFFKWRESRSSQTGMDLDRAQELQQGQKKEGSQNEGEKGRGDKSGNKE